MNFLCAQPSPDNSVWGLSQWKDLITIIGVPLGIGTFYLTQWLANNQARASNMINLLNIYLKTGEYKVALLISDTPKEAQAIQYWTAYMDLHWTQYDLWNNGYIGTRAMAIWCYGKWHKYHKDKGLKVNDATITKNLPANEPKDLITYKIVWEKLRDENYFPPGDSFTELMTLIYAVIKEDPSGKEKDVEAIMTEIKEILEIERKKTPFYKRIFYHT